MATVYVGFNGSFAGLPGDLNVLDPVEAPPVGLWDSLRSQEWDPSLPAGGWVVSPLSGGLVTPGRAAIYVQEGAFTRFPGNGFSSPLAHRALVGIVLINLPAPSELVDESLIARHSGIVLGAYEFTSDAPGIGATERKVVVFRTPDFYRDWGRDVAARGYERLSADRSWLHPCRYGSDRWAAAARCFRMLDPGHPGLQAMWAATAPNPEAAHVIAQSAVGRHAAEASREDVLRRYSEALAARKAEAGQRS